MKAGRSSAGYRWAYCLVAAVIGVSACTSHRTAAERTVPLSSARDLHYDVLAELDTAAGTVTSDALITIPGAVEGPNVTFILGGSRVVEVAESQDADVAVGPTSDPWKGLQQVVVTPHDTTRAVTVRIRSHGRPLTGGSPPINIVSAGLTELSLDGMWLPIVRGFTTKYTADVRILGLPDDAVLVGAGDIRNGAGERRIRRTVADFDFAFVAAPRFEVVDGGAYRLYTVDPLSETAVQFRAHATGAVRFLENWFGDLPAKPVRLAIVRRERSSGYARSGYIVVTEGSRKGDAAIARFTAHEMAHAWWAPVDPNTEHRWLQESVAEYIALRYVESALGREAVDSIVREKTASAAAAGPLLGAGARPDRVLYEKGPLLLIELERSIGRDRLDAVLSRLARRPPSVTAEFLEVLRSVAGPAAAEHFEAQLRS